MIQFLVANQTSQIIGDMMKVRLLHGPIWIASEVLIDTSLFTLDNDRWAQGGFDTETRRAHVFAGQRVRERRFAGLEGTEHHHKEQFCLKLPAGAQQNVFRVLQGSGLPGPEEFEVIPFRQHSVSLLQQAPGCVRPAEIRARAVTDILGGTIGGLDGNWC